MRDLLGRMTQEEKFWQLYMSPGDLDDPAHDYSHGSFGLQIRLSDSSRSPGTDARNLANRINRVQHFFVERTRLGIPIIPFEEAVHGLVAPGATVFPQAIGLAATWDTSLVTRVGAAIGQETRSRGIRQVLSPVVNLARDVRWGRVEETYGEDPFLASAMTRAYVGALERAGVITTPKHFVANVGEGGRDSYPINISERQLEEIYFPPFRAAIAAGARSVMTAYNSVNGVPATQNRWLLTQKLKGEWRFPGFVISDAAATAGATVLHLTEADTRAAARDAFAAGLDVVFQSSWEQHRPYLETVRQGMIPVSLLDSAVARVLRAKFQLGLFEHPYPNADSAALANHSDENVRLSLEAARASIVLLKNDRGLLPLPDSLDLALIGPDAIEARLGGYSAPGEARVSILDAIRARIGAEHVRYRAGPGRDSTAPITVPEEYLSSAENGHMVPGLRGEYFNNPRLEGDPAVTRSDSKVDFTWTFNPPAQGLATGWYSVRWLGRVTVPPGPARRIGIEGNDGYRLFVDGKLVIDDWKKQSYSSRLSATALAPGRSYDLRLEYFESTGGVHLKLVWESEHSDYHALIDSAVAIASRSDAAVVVVGIEEGEFRDRAFLGLPGRQEELIKAVAATGKPVCVVLVGGSAVTMSGWLDRVDGVIEAWYPGEQGGRAVADVLFGDYNPAGRLPITFPMAEGQLPLYYNHEPTGRGDDYVDLTGQPLFPFGFGLSYTRFEYSNLTIEPGTVATDGLATIRATVRNTGSVAGDEVVQLYIHDVLASVVRPVMELKGFARIHLEPGSERQVTFRLGPDQLRLFDARGRWEVERGEFRVMVGSSSRDIRLYGILVVR